MSQGEAALQVGRPAAAASGRLRSLDGLRGIASLVVVIHHSLLTVPVLAAPYYGHGSVPLKEGLAWTMVHTPLHLMWGGTEAVYIFFVLSGLVLMLPVLRGGFSWSAYYPSRLIRLYLPVFAIVILGYLSILLIPRVGSPGLSEWLTDRPVVVSVSNAVRDLTLLGGASGLISPLWSLQWEVLFSLLLPGFFLFAVLWRRIAFLKGVILFGAICAGVLSGRAALFYMPIFGLGVLLAVELEAIRLRLSKWGARAWIVFGVASVLLLSAFWLVLATGVSGAALNLARACSVLGAVGVVLAVGFCEPLRKAMEVRPVQWLGTISFSLYLVHEPIVMAVGYMCGSNYSLLVLPISVCIGLIFASFFFVLIERPSHRLARRVAARFR